MFTPILSPTIDTFVWSLLVSIHTRLGWISRSYTLVCSDSALEYFLWAIQDKYGYAVSLELTAQFDNIGEYHV